MTAGDGNQRAPGALLGVMRLRTRTWVLAAVALLAAGCGSSHNAAVAASATSDAYPLPAVELVTLDGTATWSTTELAGTPAVINIWATWCAYCVEEMPQLQAAHEALGDRVQFIGVDRADDVARAVELAARTGVTYPLVADPDSVFFAAVGARAMPTTLLVDAAGNVVHRHAGPLDTATLQRLILDHLGV